MVIRTSDYFNCCRYYYLLPIPKVYDSEILDEEEGRKESNSDLKEKVAANFDTKKLIQF